jgi:hypothetical protein
MKTLVLPLAILSLSLAAGVAVAQQYPMMDTVAAKVVSRYESATCEQLWQARAMPKTDDEQFLVSVLRQNADMRRQFFAKVSGPVMEKMFSCGMIP